LNKGETVMLNYDPEEREEIEQALEGIGYTLEDLS
jgi:hypothetical protein